MKHMVRGKELIVVRDEDVEYYRSVGFRVDAKAAAKADAETGTKSTKPKEQKPE